MAKKNLKLPPQHIEAEQSVLGGLMLDNKAIINIADIIRAEDFYSPAHSKIYEAILKLYEKHHPIDILSVTTRLTEDGALADVGGTSYVAKLIDSVPSSFHVGHYAALVKEKKIRRDLVSLSAEINDRAFGDGETGTEDLLDEIEKKVFAVSQRSITQRFQLIKDGLKEAYERIEKLSQGGSELRGIPCGFPELDSILSGFQRSDLFILGARPSLGKTSLALDFLRHASVKHQKSVALFSLEMSRDQVHDRLISAESGINLWRIRNGKLKDEDFENIQHGLDRLANAKIFIDDTASPNILQMRSMARRLQAEHGLDMVIVDYLQLIQPRTTSDNMVHQITEISRGLKSLARELNVPIIALSQLSRTVEHRDYKVPRLADLRDSGSIEQDADVVAFIYRRDRDKQNATPEEQNIAEIIVAKHRNGPLGTVRLYFDADCTSFRSLDTQHGTASLT